MIWWSLGAGNTSARRSHALIRPVLQEAGIKIGIILGDVLILRGRLFPRNAAEFVANWSVSL